MIKKVKKLIRKSFHTLGYEIRNKRSVANGRQKKKKSLIFDNIFEALHFIRGGGEASFLCPLDSCVHRIGLNFASGGWHPFTETLREYTHDKSLTYEQSSLKSYYERWQPVSAYDTYIGFEDAPKKFKTLPPHLFYLTPWSSQSISQTDRRVRKWNDSDDTDHGGGGLDLDSDGFRDFGPVSLEKGELEFNRLVKIYNSISAKGYDRSFGDIEVLVLKRGSELRFIHKGGGYHRASAMAALSFEMIPATFSNPWIISLDESSYWSQVRTGVWSRDQAENYFHHLFDFDSREWADKYIL